MKEILLIFFASVLISIPACAQWRASAGRLEGGVWLGMAGYSGDLSAHRVEPSELQPAYGAFLRYHLRRQWALKVHLYSGAFSGSDSHSPERAARSFAFGTAFTEVAGSLEWHLFRQRDVPETGWLPFPFSPYLYAGAGVVFIDVNAHYYGAPERANDFIKVPLPEEGPASALVLPVLGGGVRIVAYAPFIFGLEGGIRPALSDRLDGVSQNGNPAVGDWYFFFGATAVFVFP